MPPCSWCTNPANNPDSDEDVDEESKETDAERFDRVMKELVSRR